MNKWLTSVWSRRPGGTVLLDWAISALLIVTCSVLLYRTVMAKAPAPRPKPPTFAVGDVIPDVPDLHLDRAEETLLLALRDGCRYCDANMPFYQQLLATTQRLRADRKLQLLLLATGDRTAAAQYLEKHNLSLDGIVVVPPDRRAGFKIPGTPTLLQMGRDGVIKSVWVGQLNKDSEDLLQRALLDRH